jgi:asparagine synthase (glutamine-hydrolysing)
MCGIFSVFGTIKYNRNHYLEYSKKLRHRGPDWNGIYKSENAVVCHERLSIVGVNDGSQPIVVDDIILSINGEIYNYKELYKTSLQDMYIPQTESDCEVIIYLYKEFGEKMLSMLDGIFSFVLYDKKNESVLIARDPIGIIPLYYGTSEHTNSDTFTLTVASEMKCLDDCSEVSIFTPGTFSIYNISNKKFDNHKTRYYNPRWKQNTEYNQLLDGEQLSLLENKIKTCLTESVEKRLMADVPFGVLLSGGLDSSLIASITSRLMKDKSDLFGNKLHSFSIGLKDSPDLKAARKVADFLKTTHHELHFSVQDGIDCIRDLIYHLETYDVTTIRASTPMFLMSRKIKSYGIKMVLSGEGADEVFGGYLYFHKAPTTDDFNKECYKRVCDLHQFDCLRANKSTMAWGLEARVPFLDKRFLELCMPIHANNKLRNKIEKYILRKSFDDKSNPYLPEEILWRQKEQFTDGVGYNWLDTLVAHCEKEITDDNFETIKNRYSNDPYPIKTKEEAYYRSIYEELFPNRECCVARWIPQTNWEGVSYDPSGRAQDVHVSFN